jgi:hypothetical protein
MTRPPRERQDGSLPIQWTASFCNERVAAHVKQYPVIHGLPEKSRPADILGHVYLDAMTLQSPNPHVAGRLVTIDEENFLVSKNWLATKWRRAIHTSPPKGKRNWADCPPAGCGSQHEPSGCERHRFSQQGFRR